MYEQASVFREGYGEGKVILSTKCSGPNRDTWLLKIKFNDLDEEVAMYDDEIEILDS